jgi:hypothetical protein
VTLSSLGTLSALLGDVQVGEDAAGEEYTRRLAAAGVQPLLVRSGLGTQRLVPLCVMLPATVRLLLAARVQLTPWSTLRCSGARLNAILSVLSLTSSTPPLSHQERPLRRRCPSCRRTGNVPCARTWVLPRSST